jgi:hypothetical protein
MQLASKHLYHFETEQWVSYISPLAGAPRARASALAYHQPHDSGSDFRRPTTVYWLRSTFYSESPSAFPSYFHSITKSSFRTQPVWPLPKESRVQRR